MKHFFFVLLFIPQILFAKSLFHSEDWHVRQWCTNGFIETVQSDRTRVDCETYDYAIEFDWARKYNEAIGQSLGYSIRIDKKAGIVLIMRKPIDIKKGVTTYLFVYGR